MIKLWSNLRCIYYPSKKLKVLILGGGDGLLARKLFSYQNVAHITLCEIDAAVVELCKSDTDIVRMNEWSLSDDSIVIHYADAFEYITTLGANTYDLIIADFPDAHAPILSKLYSREFYQNIAKILSKDGVFVTIASEVNYTQRCFHCIGNTLETSFQNVRGYSINMPKSYGNIGLFITSQIDISGISLENEVFLLRWDTINTIENNLAYKLFREESEENGFIPGVTNRK